MGKIGFSNKIESNNFPGKMDRELYLYPQCIRWIQFMLRDKFQTTSEKILREKISMPGPFHLRSVP